MKRMIETSGGRFETLRLEVFFSQFDCHKAIKKVGVR
jgi:hypothetical protein